MSTTSGRKSRNRSNRTDTKVEPAKPLDSEGTQVIVAPDDNCVDKNWLRRMAKDTNPPVPIDGLSPGLQPTIEQAERALFVSREATHDPLITYPKTLSGDTGKGMLDLLAYFKGGYNQMAMPTMFDDVMVNMFSGMEATSSSSASGGAAGIICASFTVVGISSNDDGEEALVVEFRRKGRPKRVSIPKSLIGDGSSNKLLSVLNGHGLFASTEKNNKAHLQSLFNALNEVPTLDRIEGAGWLRTPIGWVFAGGNKVYGQSAGVYNEGAKRFIVEPNVCHSDKLGSAGTFEGWKAGIADKAAGNSRIIFGLGVAFAGPLLHFSTLVSNSIFHLYDDSSRGKSTLLKVAGSVYGGDPMSATGFAHTWNGTPYAHAQSAASHSGMLMCLDEIKEANKLQETAYALGNGASKSQGAKTGGLRKALPFRLMFLSAGEETFAEHSSRKAREQHVAMTNFSGGEVRLVDVPAGASAGKGAFEYLHGAQSARSFADALMDVTRTHYGHAGPAYLESILAILNKDDGDGEKELRASIKSDIDAFLEHVKITKDSDAIVTRTAVSFGLLYAGLEQAVAANVIDLSSGDTMNAIVRCFEDWRGARGAVVSANSTGTLTPSAVIHIQDWLYENSSRFHRVGTGTDYDPDTMREPSRKAGVLFKSVDANSDSADKEEWFCISPKQWKQMLAEYPRANVEPWLHRRGFLMTPATPRKGQGRWSYASTRGGISFSGYAIAHKLTVADVDAIKDGTVTLTETCANASADADEYDKAAGISTTNAVSDHLKRNSGKVRTLSVVGGKGHKK